MKPFSSIFTLYANSIKNHAHIQYIQNRVSTKKLYKLYLQEVGFIARTFFRTRQCHYNMATKTLLICTKAMWQTIEHIILQSSERKWLEKMFIKSIIWILFKFVTCRMTFSSTAMARVETQQGNHKCVLLYAQWLTSFFFGSR